MPSPALVVFDMAGTTVEDRGEVPAAFTAALAAHGLVITPAELQAVRGASKREAIHRLIPDGAGRAEEAARAFATFQRELERRYGSGGVRAMPGAGQVFRRLRANGVRVALTTGFDRESTGIIVDALGWRDHVVDAIVCGDDVAQGRPAPDLILRAMADTGIGDPQAVAVVGDTALDLEAGARAGVRWNIGVLSGAHTREVLETAPHTHLIASVADLPAVWGMADS